jgi:hypothetical protein
MWVLWALNSTPLYPLFEKVEQKLGHVLKSGANLEQILDKSCSV